jgi:DEAD/DEAH box helicase
MKPFSQLCELSSFASHLVYSEPTVPRIAWNQDMTVVSIDGEQIVLDGLREGLKTQLEVVRGSILLITGEVEVPNWLSQETPIKDDPRNCKPGYSFLEDSRFRDAHLPLLQKLVDRSDWRIGSLDNEGRWMWNVSAIFQFFQKTAAIQKALMPLIRICSNERGTELSDTKIANSTSRLRNLSIYQGRLYNNSAYSKTTENTSHDSYNPSLLPPEVSLLLVHYLVVIRPIEKVLSGVIWDDDIAGLYGTYLFLAHGRRLNAEDDSEFLGHFFREHCNAAVQLNRWRQTSASLSREFIDDRFLAASRRSAVGMGHSVATARKHYAQDYSTPAFATSDVLYEQSWVDTEFHALLGFGSKPPPVALRLRKSDEDSMQETIRAALNDMKQGIVREVLEGLGDVIKREISVLIPKDSQSRSDTSTKQLEENTPHPYGCHSPIPSSSGPLYTSRQKTPIPSSSIAESGPLYDSRHQNGSPVDENPSELEKDCHRNLTSPPPVTLPSPSRPNLSSSSSPSPSPAVLPSASLSSVVLLPSPPVALPSPPRNNLSSTSHSSPAAPPSRYNLSSTSFPSPASSSSIALPSPLQHNLSPPSPSRDVIPDHIFAAFEKIYGPEARPKSKEQYRLCKEVLQKEKNVVAILPTGSGKSAAWLVPAMVERDSIVVVVVPFRQLLMQHLTTALSHNLNAIRWTSEIGTNVDQDTNLLFVACESIKGKFSE